MAEIGKINKLTVVKEVDFGMYLNGGEEHGEILLPKRYLPENCSVNDELDVFIYRDSEDRLIATTETPLAKAEEFAALEVVAANNTGAFLNWGLPKDLLLPFREQKTNVQIGDKVFVFVYLDAESKRLVASAKIEKHIDNLPVYYEPGNEVDAIIWAKTDLGFKVVIENLYSGMIYHNEIFQPLEIGQRISAFVSKVREDDKIDLTLNKTGYNKVTDTTDQVVKLLENNNGTLPYNDKSSAEDIRNFFGMSKKTFKMTIGSLYKKRIIEITPEGIKLL